MIPTVGRALLHLGLGAAAAAMLAGGFAGARRSEEAARWARHLTVASAVAFALDTLLMLVALVQHDFSVAYVAEIGSASSPPLIAAVSLWSSLDGSMLFWAFILAIYAGIFAIRARGADPARTGWALAVQMAVLLFFGLLVAGVAAPFDRVSPVPSDGPGPNPLLQNHVLMAIHPPTLYLGYVGLAVPFAMAVAALATGRLDAAWTRSLRAWSLWVWAFLTLGILLGGWWSYEVLGWGGYWAWDPVENASLLPWLTFTAFLHSLIVAERRGRLAATSLVLVIVSFLLTILGTFMTRSGVFNSVHSFTQSPIGPIFLGFLTLLLVGSVLLLAARMDSLKIDIGPRPGSATLLSRDSAFLLTVLVLVAFAATVLLGTVYPLVNQAITGGQVSVGGPYYETMTVPLCAGLLLLMVLGPALPWREASPAVALRQLAPPLVIGLLAALWALVEGLTRPWVLLTLALSVAITVVSLRELWLPVRARLKKGDPAWKAPFLGLATAPRRSGAHIAHLGVVLAALAISFSSSFKAEIELTLGVGESAVWEGYTLGFLSADRVEKSHLTASRAHFAVFEGARDLGEVIPALNLYHRNGQSIGTPAVLHRLSEDLYLSVVQVNARQVTVRAYLQPLVSWLWIGGLLTVLGSLVAALPALRTARRKEESA
ncbi:MAG: heme lyase CcmF/NrfE family subunit [Pseudomonadota bacterium]